MASRTLPQVLATFAAVQSLAAAPQAPELHLSIGWRGPTLGPLGRSEGHVLVPPDPALPFGAPPAVALTPAELGLTPLPGSTPMPGVPSGIDLDALSFGDEPLLPRDAVAEQWLLFGVDRHARGNGAVGNELSREALADEASADLYAVPWPGANLAGSWPWVGVPRLVVDGDGRPSAGPPLQVARAGLVEPNPAALAWPSQPHDAGDQLDAAAVTDSPNLLDVYFSLAGGLVDPLDPTGSPTPVDSAAWHNVVGGDVLHVNPGSPFQVYATAAQLGLDRLGAGTDDLDALFLRENGIPGYQLAQGAFAWVTKDVDVLVYSVRRRSAIIGQLDGRLGLPICEGDLLVPPSHPGRRPEILVPAELLGLRAARSGATANDDLASVSGDPLPFEDCNKNLIPDHLDIIDTTSFDLNENCIPDECEYDTEDFCDCKSASGSACGNSSQLGGCANGLGRGAQLAGLGPFHAGDTFRLVGCDLPADVTAMLYTGSRVIAPARSGSGLLCLDGAVVVGAPRRSTAAGTVVFGPGIAYDMRVGGLGTIDPGETVPFQVWYRDPASPCHDGFNWTNGVAVRF